MAVPPSSTPKRIAIVGGGPAGLSLAYSLTRNEPEAYQITIYEMSWRLGGKTASGRARDGRNEEHGLHILFGCYHNVFQLMMSCYDDLRTLGLAEREHRFRYFHDALEPHHFGVIGDDRVDPWKPIYIQFPSNRGVPGDDPLPSTLDLFLMVVQLTWAVLIGPRSLRGLQRTFSFVFDFGNRWKRRDLSRPPWEERHRRRGPSTRLGGDLASRAWLKLAKLALDRRRITGRTTLRAVDLTQRLWRTIEGPLAGLLGQSWAAADFALALTHGLIVDEVLTTPGGFEKIDAFDLRDWLKAHGASERTLNSPWMRMIYDAAFSYPDGGRVHGTPHGPEAPLTPRPEESIAAGAAVRVMLFMALTFKGCFYHKMEAGMGDVIHSPLYLVLKQRGVRFEFFHRLSDVKAAPTQGGAWQVQELEFDALPDEVDYEPLVPVNGLLCWPSAPKLDQLPKSSHARAQDAETYAPGAPGRRVTRTLGEHFDLVVLAIPVKCLPYACPSLLEADRKRLDRPSPSLDDQQQIDTVQTIALQTWMKPELKELGWHEPSPLLSLFLDPLNTWCDMTHLLDEEGWSGGGAPRSLAYFCGAFPHEHAFPSPEELRKDPGAAARAHAAIQANARKTALKLLKDDLHHLLPTVLDPSSGFRFSVLTDPNNQSGEARLDAQYLRVNYEPHALCTLALPGKTRHRMKADGTGYDNLFVSGDWIDNGVYVAAVEGAFQSGLRTARAIAQHCTGNGSLYTIVAEDLLNLAVLSPEGTKPPGRPPGKAGVS